DSYDDVWHRDLSPLEKLRLLWDEHIVLPRRVPQVFALASSFLIVLSLWIIIKTSPDSGGGRNGNDDLFDDKAPKDLPTDWTNTRLPKHVIPTRYAVDMETNLAEFAFNGSVGVRLNITSSTKVVVIHSVELDLDEFELEKVENIDEKVQVGSGMRKDRIVKPNDVRVDQDLEFVVLRFDRALKAGVWDLRVGFNGTLTDSLRGFYRSSYVNSVDGKLVYIASTQFQSTDARRAFPCLDEPGLKATFQLNMTVGGGFHALSNMPTFAIETVPTKKTPILLAANNTSLSSITTVAWRKKYAFQESARMSTYLYAFVVSNFECIDDETRKGVKVSVCTQPHRTGLGTYALKAGVKILEYYEKTFGIAYPLPKLDLVAIPDFAAGAMENWGLVNYRDTALLFDENLSSAKDKQRVVSVISHELAHQWFGNLVTMEWWTDLWLNEGFSNYMEYKGANAAEPDWRIEDQFISEETQKAMDADASLFTHPVAVDVADPSEIEGIFDDISYAKGASLLRMLENWLNAVRDKKYFFNRISEYLKRYSYTNAETAELWAALDLPGLKLAKVMDSWTSQPGYPVLIVEQDGGDEGDDDFTGYTVRQKRFLLAEALNGTSWLPPNTTISSIADVEFLKDFDPLNQTWSVPVMIRGHGRSGTRIGGFWLDLIEGGEKRVLKDESGAQILLLNAARSGLYRVMYPEHVWDVLVEWTQSDVLTPTDYCGLISDAFALNFAGILQKVEIPLQLTRSLVNQTDFIVWKVAIRELNILDDVLASESSYPLLQEFLKRTISNIVLSLGWNETSTETRSHHGRALLRSELLTLSLSLGMHDTVTTALDYFHQLRNASANAQLNLGLDGSDKEMIGEIVDKVQGSLGLATDLLGVIWDAGVIYGDDSDFEFAMSAYLTSNSATDKNRIMHALASARKPYQIREVLDLTLSGKVRKQDIPSFLRLIASLNGATHTNVWTFLKDRWRDFVDIWSGSDWTPVNGMLTELVSLFTEPSAIDEAQNLFITGKSGRGDWFVPPLARQAVLKGVEIARVRVHWLKKYHTQVQDWLRHELKQQS
ncbi:hypothetical protein HDU76_013989, partial [Blyttiomyces sp. JEL0837]